MKTASAFFTFSRQDFYNYLNRFKKWGVLGLFGERELKNLARHFKETRLKKKQSIGFAPFPSNQMGMDHDRELTAALGSITDTSGIIATVSWCSGDDGCARGVVNRTGAIAEAMEGAAVCVAAQMIDPNIRTGELRVISNTTGDRKAQIWDLGLALGRLTHVCERLGVLGRAD